MSLFDDLSESVADELVPPLDRSIFYPGVSSLMSNENDPLGRRKYWRARGYLILPEFLPHPLIDHYVARRQADGEYKSPTPYMWVDEVKDICLWPPLVAVLEHLICEPMALHLNLTGWLSTERDFHQDDYLNPHNINSYYAAVWMALDDISPDSGPFEYAPGSHKWPLTRCDKVKERMDPAERDSPDWPRLSQGFVSRAIEEELARTGLTTERFIAERGDVLIWHGRLAHRGTVPNVPGTERRCLISHYSGIPHRTDMPVVARWTSPHYGDGGHYFVLREDEANRERAKRK